MRSGPGFWISLPLSRMVPSTGRRKPAMPLSKVDLPQPDGPRTMKRSPRWTLNPTRYVAVTRCCFVLYCSVTPSTSRSGAAPTDVALSFTLAASLRGDFGEKQVGPRRRLVLDAARLVHEFGVFHHILRHDREYVLGIVQQA